MLPIHIKPAGCTPQYWVVFLIEARNHCDSTQYFALTERVCKALNFKAVLPLNSSSMNIQVSTVQVYSLVYFCQDALNP